MRRFGLLAVPMLLVMVVAGPVAGAKPHVERIPIDEQFTDEFLSDVCGFEVTVTLTGHIVLHFWEDRDIVNFGIRGWLSAGGATLRFVDAGSDKTTFLDDGSVKVEVHGNIRLITVKGKGAVDGAAGRLVFTISPLLDEEGNPVLDDEGFPIFVFEELASSGFRGQNVGAVCEALAPAA